MTSKEIRKSFLDFFISKNHRIVPSAPIVLKNDLTLMFTNSGMNQFKDFLLGYQKPTILRIANIQKCLRVSGKHNDLDDVGKDTYHHTMFEMLGNWSFGDYFKKEAITWAFELLTEVYKIPQNNLYVTIFEGDESENLEKDEDAFYYWKNLIDESQILNGNKKDNFWEMGVSGPCGPCSEIHVDLRSEEDKKLIDGKSLVNNDHPQVVEIWNLVFMEFFRQDNGSLKKLAHKNIDTGMGFERICMVLQNKKSNYDIDIFTPLIQRVEEITHKKYGMSEPEDVAIRVVVDHIRAVSFAIADGQLPSNSGSGYVIRRILRRATSYAFRYLNQEKPFLFCLVEVLKNQMEEFFPEISYHYLLICEVIKEEELSFLRTIKKGLIRLNDIIEKQKENKIIDGKLVYDLQDTYGFPLDLSRIILEEKEFHIDQIGYEKEKKRIQTISKASSESKISDWVVLNETKENIFVGYDEIEIKSEITRYRKIENKDGIFYQLVFDKTPFYPESGGQIGDIGVIQSINEKIKILDTKNENSLIVHITKQLPKIFSEFSLKINKFRREAIKKNHSATHILHEVLRTVLGQHIQQKGSYVSDKYLRFDFLHFSKLSDQELQTVAEKVNQKILEQIPLQEFRNISKKEALEKEVIALFGEKYGDVVRIIQFGTSKELCIGTHVKNTSEIVVFEILSENSIASGIRRIEAITGICAINYLKNFKHQINEISTQIKNKDPQKGVARIISENEKLKKQIEYCKKHIIQHEKSNWKSQIQFQNGKNYLFIKTDLDNESIKNLIFQLKNEIKDFYGVVLSSFGNKPTISIGISNSLVEKENLNANKIIKRLSKEIEGGGGGQAVFATAGGKDLSGLDRILKQLQMFN